jgi:hypothetical protein
MNSRQQITVERGMKAVIGPLCLGAYVQGCTKRTGYKVKEPNTKRVMLLVLKRNLEIE